ncbi:MAG: zinc-ribbon and DUF3426 domain-containing protein [Thiotrichales bacterium]
MYAECPHCHAIFRLTQAILQRAHGKVRCGECGTVFQALAHAESVASKVDKASAFVESRPLENSLNPAAERKAREVAKTTAPVEVVRVALNPSQTRQSPPPSGTGDAPPPKPAVTASSAPRVQLPLTVVEPPPLRRESRQKRSRSLLSTLASVVAIGLILLLAAQYLRAHRVSFANVAELRPLLTGICKLTHCELPPRRELSRLELLSHGIFSHPTNAGALMIKASFINRAEFAQPLPIVQVSLANLQGKVVARRRFGPGEYLDASSAPLNELASGQTAHMSIEVSDPGRDALAFEFDFM